MSFPIIWHVYPSSHLAKHENVTEYSYILLKNDLLQVTVQILEVHIPPNAWGEKLWQLQFLQSL